MIAAKTCVTRGASVSLYTHHDALRQVVEDSGFQLEVLPTDNGVGQGNLQKKGLEHCEVKWGGQAQPGLGEAECIRLPGGDSIWDDTGQSCQPRVPAQEKRC